MGKQIFQFPLDVMFLRRSSWTRTAYVVLSVCDLGNSDSTPIKGRVFLVVSNSTPVLKAQNKGDFSPQIKRWSTKLTFQFCLVPKLISLGDISPLPYTPLWRGALTNRMGCFTFRHLQFIENQKCYLGINHIINVRINFSEWWLHIIVFWGYGTV
jgi:hypothetical protein